MVVTCKTIIIDHSSSSSHYLIPSKHLARRSATFQRQTLIPQCIEQLPLEDRMNLQLIDGWSMVVILQPLAVGVVGHY